MPDWSYHTLFRPLLFRLPSRRAREWTLQAMGALSRLPGGTFVIKTLGHMERYPILKSERWGLPIRYPVGLSGSLDPHGTAERALAQFGFGFVEIGPVTVRPICCDLPILRDAEKEEIVYPHPHENDGFERILRRMSRKRPRDGGQPRFVRLRHMPDASPEEALAELERMMEGLAPFASGCSIDFADDRWTPEETVRYVRRALAAARAKLPSKPAFLYIPLDVPEEKLDRLLSKLEPGSWDGVVIGDAIRTENGYAVGKDGLAYSLDKVRFVRERYATAAIIAAGGVHQPQDALDLMREGADYVQLHSGLVFAGPGLPKRINEAAVYERVRREAPPEPPPFWHSWGWMWLLGLGMIVGGALAWLVAATSVLLPYDESFLGLDRPMLQSLNERLLPFMSHDRITLAGTMISIGILYMQLARYGLRPGLHWAKTALLVSGLVGFSSFFLYLGYGYFDPLHATVAAVLLPMFVVSMRRDANEPPRKPPNVRNDRTWRLAQRGQFMLVALGFALAVGGMTIAIVGVTRVFVPQDLAYLCTTPDTLAEANERLLPLIAHDRAGFGGALLSDALALLIAALWGIGQGERWLWWTFLLGGLPGFAAGFGVHWAIGYTDFVHLLPAYIAFLLYALGLVLLYPYMARPIRERRDGGGPGQTY